MSSVSTDDCTPGSLQLLFIYLLIYFSRMGFPIFNVVDFVSKSWQVFVINSCLVVDKCCALQLVHFVNRDSLGLANDFLSLGFLPDGVDIQSVSEALQASFGNGTRQSQDFQVLNLLPLCSFFYYFFS